MPVIQGKAFWAKLKEKPVKGYTPGDFEWTVDVSVDKDVAIKQGIDPFYIKNKGDEKGDYIVFKRKSIKYDGSAAKPIRVVDAKKQPWDEKKLIGNGSLVNVNYMLNEVDVGGGKKRNKPYVNAVQVWELKEFQGDDGFEAKDDGENWDEAE